jgi:hypothetical protein
MLDPRTLIACGLGAALMVVAAGAGVQTVRLADERTDHQATRTAHAQQLQRLAESARSVAIAANLALQAQQQAVATLDTQRTEEKHRALSDNDARRADDAAGRVRLRIPAVCPRPAAPADLPGPAPAASLDAAPAEIPAAFRQHLWDLRAALIDERAQLQAWQDYAAIRFGVKAAEP